MTGFTGAISDYAYKTSHSKNPTIFFSNIRDRDKVISQKAIS